MSNREEELSDEQEWIIAAAREYCWTMSCCRSAIEHVLHRAPHCDHGEVVPHETNYYPEGRTLCPGPLVAASSVGSEQPGGTDA